MVAAAGAHGADSGSVAQGVEPPGIDRLLALSDGVVAIALTLLVLQLRVPVLSGPHDPDSAGQLADQLGRRGTSWSAISSPST